MEMNDWLRVTMKTTLITGHECFLVFTYIMLPLFRNLEKQDALSSIQSAGQPAYTEYSSLEGVAEVVTLKNIRKVDKLKIMNYKF